MGTFSEPMTPAQEAVERLAEGLPGLKLAAGAVGLANHQQLLHDHAKRVQDSHRIQMRALGLELPEGGEAEADDMGITICGDNCFNQAKPDPVPTTSPPPAPQPAPPPGPAQPTTTPLWKKLAVGAALVGSGAGAGVGVPWLAGAFDEPAASQVQPATEYGLDLQKFLPSKPME